jgi:hypothetical protein
VQDSLVRRDLRKDGDPEVDVGLQLRRFRERRVSRSRARQQPDQQQHRETMTCDERKLRFQSKNTIYFTEILGILPYFSL